MSSNQFSEALESIEQITLNVETEAELSGQEKASAEAPLNKTFKIKIQSAAKHPAVIGAGVVVGYLAFVAAVCFTARAADEGAKRMFR